MSHDAKAWLPFVYDGVKVGLSPRGGGFVEGFAAACASITHALIGEPDAGKSYDPATVDLKTGTIHSYVFNMKDGGRHHPLADYATYQEIADLLLSEALDCIQGSELTAEALVELVNRARDRDGGSAGDPERGSTAKQRQPGPCEDTASPNLHPKDHNHG